MVAVLTMSVMVLAGCGDGDDDDGTPVDATSSPSEPDASGEEPLVVKTRVELPTGTILDGSTVGDSPFCPDGTFEDTHGSPEVGLVERTITCSDGTLQMGFDPQVPEGDTQRGPWRIVSGTGAYEGWLGSGEMVIRYDPSNRKHPDMGRETFTGTVTR